MAKDHKLLWAGGLVAGGLAFWEWVWKPLQATQAAIVAQSAGGLPYTPTGGGGGLLYSGPMVTAPTDLGFTPSNLDPGAAVGGPIGYCMHKKGWTQQQCQTRYTAVGTGLANAKSLLASVDADLPVQQAQLAASQAALPGAMAKLNEAHATGDIAGQQLWQHQVDGLNADIAALQAAISGAGARKTFIQGQVAALTAEAQTLFGGVPA